MLLRPTIRSSRHVSSHIAASIPRLPTRPHSRSLITIPSCPSPTCACTDMPEMPQGLEIDYSKPLNGTMAPYAEQVLICTGKDDWPSRIEEENSGDNLAADIKELMGRGGLYSDPYHNVSIANSSFPASLPNRSEVQTSSAYILPSFKYVPFLPRVSFDSVQALVKGYLLPTHLNPAHENLSPIHKDRLLRSTEQQSVLYGVQDVKDILVLICGHKGRDVRCGILGPLLQTGFERMLSANDVHVLKEPVPAEPVPDSNALPGSWPNEPSNTARVGLISHIGGHKFAGNVIIYIPPGAKTRTGVSHPLAGCGIWYGRVEPKHIEGIVQETVIEGRVIEDHFRGGIKKDGEIIRL